MDIGKVYIVGAGPGAPDLISLRGLRALRRADVVIVDELLPGSFLDELGLSLAGTTVVRRDAVGRLRDQEAVNELMLAAARNGKTVVRLKGGDPFVLGRGNEECEFLSLHGVPWEVVSGQSASTAGPAAARLPLTWRDSGRSFAVVSARRAGGGTNESFPRAESLVVMMGVAVLGDVASRLLGEGWPADTPAAVLERATMPWERRVYAPLSAVAATARAEAVASPALLVVGVAAARRHAFQGEPVVVFTGLDPTSFRTFGDVLHWPALQVVPDHDGLDRLPEAIGGLKAGAFAHVVFTSKLGVASFFAAADEGGLDARLLAGARVVAAGAGTGERLRENGVRADAVPDEGGTRGILNVLGDVAGAGVLLVQGTHAPAGLTQALEALGARTTRLALHRVVPHPELGRPLPRHDVIYFVSPSGVRAYWGVYGKAAFGRQVWCIGRVTLEALERRGINGTVVDPHVPSQRQNATVAAH